MEHLYKDAEVWYKPTEDSKNLLIAQSRLEMTESGTILNTRTDILMPGIVMGDPEAAKKVMLTEIELFSSELAKAQDNHGLY